MQDDGGKKKRDRKAYEGPFCGAKRRDGSTCKNPPMENGRCRMHGGKSRPPGPTHHSYKHGRTSKLAKHLPEVFGRVYSESYSDADLLSIRSEAALLETRVKVLCERLYTGESGQLWKRLLKHWNDFEEGNRLSREAASTEDPERMGDLRQQAQELIQSAVQNIGRIIREAEKDESNWKELIETSQQSAGLKQAEMGRLKQLQMMMTAEEAIVLMHQMKQAVADVVSDPQLRQRIAARFAQLAGGTESVPAAGLPAVGGEVIEGQASE
jgi:hypothetical protein